MRIPLLDGRDFRPAGGNSHYQIVGLIADARSRDRLRWAIRAARTDAVKMLRTE